MMRCLIPAIRAALAACLLTLWPAPAAISADICAEHGRPYLNRAKAFLAAGDYRRALEAAQKNVDESPTAASYIYLTYIYQAIDGYLEHLSRTEQWGVVDRVYLNLASKSAEDLVDPPGGLARIAKEIDPNERPAAIRPERGDGREAGQGNGRTALATAGRVACRPSRSLVGQCPGRMELVRHDR